MINILKHKTFTQVQNIMTIHHYCCALDMSYHGILKHHSIFFYGSFGYSLLTSRTSSFEYFGFHPTYFSEQL